MKILELRFKNLNSLYGEWLIDFTHPEYVSNGIFALTGPTGAGKSTILDALCLALYGATPRLGKITKSSNDIMSRQTGECYAEVVFESQAGRFRCQFSQHRARKKAGGDLQNPRHEIAEADGEQTIIESQIRRVATVIEDKTGMDFERFTRSMLLAQGGFDSFLKADAEQKSRILEQITGTGIYTEISRSVHERHRSERERLTRLRDQTSGIQLLEPEQEAEIEQQLESKRAREGVLTSELEQTRERISWLNEMEKLENELHELVQRGVEIDAQACAFVPQRQSLNIALKAASLDGPWAILSTERQQCHNDQQDLTNAQDALPQQLKNFEQYKAALDTAEQGALTARQAQASAEPVLQKVRSMDQSLASQQSGIARDAQACNTVAAQIEILRKDKAAVRTQRDSYRQSQSRVADYLQTHARDAWLVGGLGGVEIQLRQLVAKQDVLLAGEGELTRATLALVDADAALKESRVHLGVQQQQGEAAVKQLAQQRAALQVLLDGRQLREYRDQKDTLLREMLLLRKIADLESERARLQDGQACPLCGAEEHPYALGNIPMPDDKDQHITRLEELIGKAEGQQSEIEKQEREVDAQQETKRAREKHEIERVHAQSVAASRLALGEQQLARAADEFEDDKVAVLAQLVPLGIDEIPDSGALSLLESLQSRLEKWQAKQKQSSETESQIVEQDGELKRLDALINSQDKSLRKQQAALTVAGKALQSGQAERQELFGERSPDTEAARLKEAIDATEQAEKQQRMQRDAAQQALQGVQTHIDGLKKRIQSSKKRIAALQGDFSSALQGAGFADEAEFLQAQLSATEREALQASAQKLDAQRAELVTREKDRREHLEFEAARKLTDIELQELMPLYAEQEQALRQLRDEVSGLTHQLRENEVARQRIADKQCAIDAQRVECQRWDNLHALIGSSDGKKYRNFAQGLTFELMVAHANRELEKMTDRYLLMRDATQPLALNVVDNYQAGEIRSTRNLSGGESFIVSLTLALGLSKMASRKVRVDSLFLDEGFGSLDEDALETALETLSGLQQDGKLIGIISHVSALKDRISTQIRVKSGSGGKSTLSGPGCSVVNVKVDANANA